MDTTVTMSLERFKELESAEIALKRISTDDKIYVSSGSFCGSLYVIFSRDKMLESLRNEAKRANEYRDYILQSVQDFEELNKVKVSFFDWKYWEDHKSKK